MQVDSGALAQEDFRQWEFVTPDSGFGCGVCLPDGVVMARGQTSCYVDPAGSFMYLRSPFDCNRMIPFTASELITVEPWI